MSNKILILLFSCMQITTLTKVLIITHSFNRPDFIEIHYKTFHKLLEDDFEYVVFNDAVDENLKRKIEEQCKKLNIMCYRIPQELHSVAGRGTPGARHIDGIHYALNKIGYEHNDVVLLIDSDMFLVKPFNITKYMEKYDMVGEKQWRGEGVDRILYFAPDLVFINMKTLPNKRTLSFEGGIINGHPCDVGGHTYYYLKDNPEITTLFFESLHIGRVKSLNPCMSCNNLSCEKCHDLLRKLGFDENQIAYIQMSPENIEFDFENHFLHYRGGSNWDNKSKDYHIAKTSALKYLMQSLGITLTEL